MFFSVRYWETGFGQKFVIDIWTASKHRSLPFLFFSNFNFIFYRVVNKEHYHILSTVFYKCDFFYFTAFLFIITKGEKKIKKKKKIVNVLI